MTTTSIGRPTKYNDELQAEADRYVSVWQVRANNTWREYLGE